MVAAPPGALSGPPVFPPPAGGDLVSPARPPAFLAVQALRLGLMLARVVRHEPRPELGVDG